MEITIDKDELYRFIKKAVREVLEEEMLERILKQVPPISQEEMRDVENLYGKPPIQKETAYKETIEI